MIHRSALSLYAGSSKLEFLHSPRGHGENSHPAEGCAAKQQCTRAGKLSTFHLQHVLLLMDLFNLNSTLSHGA